MTESAHSADSLKITYVVRVGARYVYIGGYFLLCIFFCVCILIFILMKIYPQTFNQFL